MLHVRSLLFSVIYVACLQGLGVHDRIITSIVKFPPWPYTMADFVPATIGCNTYQYQIRDVSTIGHNVVFIW